MEANLKKRKRLSKEEALEAMQRFCVYQDRCHQEVRYRLIEHSVYGDELEEVISDLITDNFLNEERFAIAFASGRFKIKRWGKIKIKQELKRREISDYCIKKALNAIDEDDYYETLCRSLETKWDGHQTDFKTKQKLIAFLQRRGFEYPLIKMALEDLFK